MPCAVEGLDKREPPQFSLCFKGTLGAEAMALSILRFEYLKFSSSLKPGCS